MKTEFKRIRDWMEIPSRLMPGPRNSITDVPGVAVGHCTKIEGKDVRTGITVIKQHQGNVVMHRTPAAVFAGNGHTKAAGTLQLDELGELESYIALTNTLSVGTVLQALVDHHKEDLRPLSFRSLNAVVAETNDGSLSDILTNHITAQDLEAAIAAASPDVTEGAVGAGTGCTCFGWKGGIGTSSRVIKGAYIGEPRDYTVGVLTQANFGGNLNIYGHQLPLKPMKEKQIEGASRGSCIMIVATDAPMNQRQLERLASRALVGMTACGSFMGNSSGDLAIAFTNCPDSMRDFTDKHIRSFAALHNDQLNPFFEGVADAAREAVYNALCMAPDMTGWNGNKFKGFDPGTFANILPLK